MCGRVATYYNIMNKEKFLDLKKLIKEESASQRLQSLRLPRDLNLGGTKVKKNFVPNLNVVRNKDKIKDIVKKVDQRRNKINSKTNQKASPNQRFIQSSGIFSEGIGLDGKKISRVDGRYSSNVKENDFASLPVPTIKKDSWDCVEKHEETLLNEIMANDDADDIEDEKLPFQIISWNDKDFKNVPSISIKNDVKSDVIKTEFDEVPLTNLPLNKLKSENMECPIEEYQNSDTFSDQHPALTLWGLPYSFAGKHISEDPNCTKLLDYGLQDMPEGQIGKLVMRKSGRVEIHIGKMKYNLEPTELCLCREEIVSLNTKENEESSAAVLGQIQSRYLLNADWGSIFQETNKNCDKPKI